MPMRPYGRIHHQMHGTVRLQHLTQRGKPRVGVREMMQNTGADDLIEAGPRARRRARSAVGGPGDSSGRACGGAPRYSGRWSALTSMAITCAVGPAHGVPGGLRCSTAGNEDGKVVPIGSGRPEEMVVGSTPALIAPELSILLEARDGPRIGIPVVEVADLCGHRAFGQYPRRPRVAAGGGLLCPTLLVDRHLPHHLVQVERGGFLARRELGEVLDLPCHARLHLSTSGARDRPSSPR